MSSRSKTGGRVKGTPNKRTQDLIDLIERECPGYDPIVAMAKIANDEAQDYNIRVQCHKEVAQYIHAKRKAIEVNGGEDSEGNVLPVCINVELVNSSNS